MPQVFERLCVEAASTQARSGKWESKLMIFPGSYGQQAKVRFGARSFKFQSLYF